MAYYRRSAWTSTSNRAVATKRKQVHTTLHYPGFGSSSIRTAGWSRERCFQQLRAWRNMHVGSGAYREVAYNLYALPTGDVAEGRGNRQNGANGTSTSNRAGMSIQVLIGDNEPLTQGHLNGIFAALALVESWHPGITKRQYGHSHWVSTACPGRHVRAGIPYRVGGKPSTGTGGGSPKPPVKADPNRQWRTSPRVAGFSTARVREIQRELVDAGYSVGSHGVDGSYGDATGKAVQQLQRDLGVKADGIYGPGTEKALMSLKSDIEYIRKHVDSMRWSHRGIDYVNPKDPSTKDHQVSRAHEYSWKVWQRIRLNAWRDWLRKGIWSLRSIDYVNPEKPSTKDHQIARAHEYAFEGLKETRAIRVALEAMAGAEGRDVYEAVAKALEDHDKRQVQVEVTVADAPNAKTDDDADLVLAGDDSDDED